MCVCVCVTIFLINKKDNNVYMSRIIWILESLKKISNSLQHI